jgi:hypothetical protein
MDDDVFLEEAPKVKPKIELNVVAKPKVKPKPKDKAPPWVKKEAILSVEEYSNSRLYKNFCTYEDPLHAVELYMAVKKVHAQMNEEQRKKFLGSADLNNALIWADWELPGWDWSNSFHRCSKNKSAYLKKMKGL